MKSSGKKGLGRGLGALLPSAIQEVRPGESVEKIQIAQIVPNRYQPRQHFDPDKLKELADSIKHFGVLQPVVLRKLEEGYELVSGERRCRASTLAGEKTVPAVVRDYTDKQMSEIALVENLQRDDLNPIEEAVAYKRLSEEFEYTQEQLAERMGKSRPAVANTLRLELVDLANIPPAAAAFIGALTAGLLASLLKNKVGYPRISVTVPSIVIMVPGLYLYRGFYNLGIMSLSVAASWFASAILIIAALPLGLIFARILTDKAFRYCT